MSRMPAIAFAVFIVWNFIPVMAGWAFQDDVAPADWDYGDHDVYAPVTEGVDWELRWTGHIDRWDDLLFDANAIFAPFDAVFWLEHQMCVGIFPTRRTWTN
ncbi:MAG: hypothetical protein M5R36_15375 [Deltaproteobacteria bacterium]|nr:hypothetical protein [Deltaproteobacteria bacterium]